MFEENLINAVRKYPCLYDKNNKTSDKTQQIIKRCWNNVSAETGEPVERCQSRWRSLRDRFVRENRNYVERNQHSMWIFMESLEFLRDFIDTRRKKLKLSLEENSQDMLQTKEEENHDESLCSNSNNDFDEGISNYSLKRSCEESLDFELEDFAAVEVQTQSNLPHNEALIETPINEPSISQSFKKSIRSRTRTRDAEAKFDMLVGTLNEYIKCSINDRKKRKHEDFFGLLNTYLSKLPEKEQDNIKADILIMVLSKTRQT
uniref:Transcription factor Adf-1 n=1 Tax=Bactrocera dorsalis TaxID=27457 RepID=A0A034WLY9_BACDO